MKKNTFYARGWRPETRAIRAQIPRTAFQEHSVPLYLTSSFVFEDAEDMRASFAEEKERMVYSRYGIPNGDEFIQKMCMLEGAEARYSFASGISAVFSTLAALLGSGEKLWMQHGTQRVQVKVKELIQKWDLTKGWSDDDSPLKMNEIGSIELLCSKEIFADPYTDYPENGSVVLISPRTNQTVAAGIVQNPIVAQAY